MYYYYLGGANIGKNQVFAVFVDFFEKNKDKDFGIKKMLYLCKPILEQNILNNLHIIIKRKCLQFNS